MGQLDICQYQVERVVQKWKMCTLIVFLTPSFDFSFFPKVYGPTKSTLSDVQPVYPAFLVIMELDKPDVQKQVNWWSKLWHHILEYN